MQDYRRLRMPESGLPEDFVVDDAVLIRGGDQDLVGEVLAQGEVEDEVAFRLAGVDAHVAEFERLEEHLVRQLALVLDAEDLPEVLVLDRVAMEVAVFLRAGAFLGQFLGDHFADLVYEFRQEAQAVVNFMHGGFVEMVMRVDIQVKLHGLARQLMRGGEIMLPSVVELDLSEVLARYLVHIFNIVLKTGPFQRWQGFPYRSHRYRTG